MNPRLTRRSSPDAGPGLSRPVQGGLCAAALILVPALAVGGSDSFRAALDFTTGVLSLVSLTASVAWGLLATDRLLLSPRHRLLAQGIHRATAIASLGFLLLHATVKVSLGHVSLIGALIPFGLGVTGTSALIGFGSLAGLLMVVAATTGALRSALAGNSRVAGRWRPLHMLAYPAWCFALVHGLYAGRPAATWVTAMYCLALAAVATAVSVRLLPRHLQRRVADSVVSLTGGVARPPAAEEQAQRDLRVSPLPGAGTVNETGRPPVSAGMDRMDRVTGVPPQRPYEEDVQALFGRTRPQPPRLAAPSPPLYEAPLYEAPPPEGSPVVVPQGRVPGRGPGMAAAYRAVSLAGEPTAPLAERVPMTEEIPVVSEAGPRPGAWPTPSPPPPARSVRPEDGPAPGAYAPPQDAYGATGASGAPSPYGADTYGTGTYGTGTYGSGATGAYAAPAADPLTGPLPGSAPYEPAERAGPAYGTSAPYPPGAGSGSRPGQDGQTPAQDTLYRPSAGEPWNAPAGERP